MKYSFLALINVLVCVHWLFLVPASQASNSSTIRYAYPDQVVLTTKTKANGKVDNPLVKVATRLFDQIDIRLETSQYPAARMFKKLQSGEADFSILVNSPLLDDCCIVSKVPVTTTELRVYFKRDVPPIHAIEDLKEKEIITLRGYSYGPLKNFIRDPSNEIKQNPTSTHRSAFAMLDQNRARYLINYKQPSIEILEQQPIKDIRYTTIRYINLYLVLHKDYPNANALMEKLTGLLQNMDVAKILNLPNDAVYAVNNDF